MSKRYFQVITQTTRESCHALAKARIGRHSAFVWFCVLIIAVGAVTLWLLWESYRATLLTTLLALLLVVMLLRVRLLGMMIYRSRNDKVDRILLSFNEDCIVLTTHVEKSKIAYSGIQKLRRDGRFLMIYPKNHAPIVFAGDEIRDGTPDAMAAFLSEKTGQNVREIGK